MVSLLLSITPGTYVVSADGERGTLLVHGLGGPTRLERQVMQ
jgi:multisubunit Na+/H+ antiporter MnhE subunit